MQIPMVPDWEGPEPSEGSASSGGANSSSLEGTSSPETVMGLLLTTPSTARSVPDDINDCDTGLPTPTSRLAYLRGCLPVKAFQEWLGISSCPPGEPNPTKPMIPTSR